MRAALSCVSTFAFCLPRQRLALSSRACACAPRGGRFRRVAGGDGRGEWDGRGACVSAASAARFCALGLDRRSALGLLDALARDELIAQLHLLRDAVNVLRLLTALGA